MKPRTPKRKTHVLLAALMRAVTPRHVERYLYATGWTRGAMRWLAHEVPLREALTAIAISELRSPREILERIDELGRW